MQLLICVQFWIFLWFQLATLSFLFNVLTYPTNAFFFSFFKPTYRTSVWDKIDMIFLDKYMKLLPDDIVNFCFIFEKDLIMLCFQLDAV